jgi:hypothetical protein
VTVASDLSVREPCCTKPTALLSDVEGPLDIERRIRLKLLAFSISQEEGAFPDSYTYTNKLRGLSPPANGRRLSAKSVPTSADRSPCREAYKREDDKDISRLLWDPKVHYRG